MDYAATQMFDYQRIYEQVVEDCPDHSIFIEIGANMGESTRYMARLLRDSGKDIRFYTVDPWTYPPMPMPQLAYIFERLAKLPGPIAPYMLFLENLKKEDLLKYVIPLKMTSAEASLLFDNEVDFVMIDGMHTYPYVQEDIELWSERLKNNGILAGHDYGLDGTKKAVDEAFKSSQIFLREQHESTPILYRSTSWSTQKVDGTFIPYEIREN